jgi:hypothetical protein
MSGGSERADNGERLQELAGRIQRACDALVDRWHDPVAQRELLATLSLGYPLFGNPAEGRTPVIRGLLSQASAQAETARSRLTKGVTGQRTTDALAFALNELCYTVSALVHALRADAQFQRNPRTRPTP